MKNDKSIETKLRSAVSHAVPDALDDILSACDHEKGKEHLPCAASLR